MERTAIILGASGLTGGLLLEKMLAEDYFSRIRILVRNDFPGTSDRLDIHRVDFNLPETWVPLIRGDVLFSCIGTTNRQVKGDRLKYRKIDYDLPLTAAREASAHGVKKLLLISSAGADRNSGNFYLRLKGELEWALQQLPFESIHILRPSFLLGKRAASRPTEVLMQKLTPVIRPLLTGRWKKYRPIESETVAQTMVKLAKSPRTGKFVYDSDEIGNLPCPMEEKPAKSIL
ncbi:MAG TPA: NAD(P)H-binding protein [Chitinophagaceae bacterium]|nr:NAD(P)H-binding protein [Chitinophagaceae bacterium]